MTTHAKLSPSASKRWMNCPGSVQLIEQLTNEGKIEENATSPWAEEGSAAHALAEKCLLEHNDAIDYLNQKIYGDFKVTEEMAEAVQVYLDFVHGCINAADDELLDTTLEVEVKCSLKPYRVKGLDGGTSDTVLIHE